MMLRGQWLLVIDHNHTTMETPPFWSNLDYLVNALSLCFPANTCRYVFPWLCAQLQSILIYIAWFWASYIPKGNKKEYQLRSTRCFTVDFKDAFNDFDVHVGWILINLKIYLVNKTEILKWKPSNYKEDLIRAPSLYTVYRLMSVVFNMTLCGCRSLYILYFHITTITTRLMTFTFYSKQQFWQMIKLRHFRYYSRHLQLFDLQELASNLPLRRINAMNK